jgi:hypothetical protein
MKDGIDVVGDVVKLVNVQAVRDLMSGGSVWPDARPDSRSTFTDIVVNCPSINNEWQQEGYVNVNVYAPAIASGTSKLPNHAKLKALSNLIRPLITDIYTDTFRVYISHAGIIMRDTDGSYFMSIELKYYSIQTQFKRA